jgi:flagellar assembly factor FliW
VTLTAARPTAPTPMEAHHVSGDIPVLELVRPMVGFPDLHRFALARLVDDGLICDLRSLEDPQVSFVVVPPGEFFDDYTPEIDDDTVAALGIEQAADLLTLVLVTLGDSAESATVNLRAPLLINHRNRRATQAILDDPALPMKAPLTGPGDSTQADPSH